MKKLILLLLFITASLKVQAQLCGEAKGDQPSSEIKTNFYFDTDDKGNPIKVPIYKWMDRFGNRYADLQIKNKRNETSNKTVPTFGFTNPDCQSQGGLFNVYVEDIQNATGTGFDLTANSQMLTVICQVFDDLDVLLNQQASTCAGVTKSGVNIRLRSFNAPSSGVLGSASSFYETEGELNGIKHGEVWKAINTGYNDNDRWDGFININLGYSNWYSGFGNTPSGQVDLYTVMLHEVLHSLGFASLINSNGESKFQGNGVDSYSPFDTFLTSDNNISLITNISGYDWDFNPANPISVLTSGCGVSGPNVEFRGNFNAPLSPVHAGASWSGGSSLSHFESNCDSYGNTADYVMNPGIAAGISRSLTQEEINTLGDLGYQLNTIYGTNTLANGSANPRQHNNFTSPTITSLVATDDYGPCCSTTNYTVEACDGNTLSISITDLLCNDIQSNANVALVEDLATNTLVPLSGNNIVYTPSQAGTQVLRYLLEDGNGNQSNYAYIYVTVLPCPGFNCTNTDTCNLICNPHFEDFDGSCNYNTCNFSSFPVGCIEGWSRMIGSPDYLVSPPCSNNNGFTNMAQLPGSPGGKILLNGHGPLLGIGFHNEAIMTNVNFDASKTYILSYNHQRFRNTTNSSASLNIGLLQFSDIYWPVNSVGTVALPSLHQTVDIVDQATIGNSWTQEVVCFTPSSSDFDIIYLQGHDNDTSVNGDKRTFIDQIELVEDKLQDIQQNYLLGCQETVVIGDALCDITNMEYSWWDVTNSSSPIQLTQGSNVITGNISIPNGSNGSELEINATQNTTFELRRNFVSSNGITIANNNCNASVQVQVTVDLDVTLTKEVVGSNSVGNGGPVTYQITVTNNTGYPINNLDITDALATNFNVNTLNVNANSNITTSNSGNLVTFTVLNLAHGASEQIVFDVVINGTIGDTVTNCASLEYLDCPLESCTDVIITSCTPVTPVITADSNDITSSLTYIIPCGETCFTLEATDITNAVYNTTDPVLTNLNGLFCLTNNNTLTSFTATITGLDSCGNDYIQEVEILVEQDCPTPCCDADFNLLDNGDFNQSTNGGNWAFNLGYVPNWVHTDGSPSINDISTNPYAWMWSYGGNGEGITSDFDFEEGITYSICFRIRTDDRNSGDPNVANNATVNLVATDTVGNITSSPTGEYIFNDTMGSYLNTWTDITLTYTPNGNYSKLWIFPFMSDPSDGVSQAELSIDDIIISICEDCETTAPTNLQVSGTTLTWAPVQGATSYIITSPGGNVPQLDCDCDKGTGISIAPVTVNTNSYTLPASLSDKCFVWQVTAICESGEKSPISEQACYKPKEDECEITAPTNLQVNGTTLTWDPVPGATSYIVLSPGGNEPQLDCDCDKGTGISLAPVTVNTNSYTLPASLSDKCFVWQVIAICKSGEKSPISKQACYTPKEEKCEVTAPTNLQVSGTTLTWNPVPGATSYIVLSPGSNEPQLDCSCDKGTGISIAPVTVNTNSYTLPASLSDKCFVWQVIAICESGEKSPISKQACYKPKEEKCEVTAPTNLQVSGTTLTWNPVSGAIAYIISSPPGGVKIIDCGCNKYNGISIAPVTVNTNSYTLPSSLKESCFVWQVTAICKNEEKSPISKQACYNGPEKGGKDVISIYPNPNKGDMNIKVDTVNDSNVGLNIYKFDGTLIKTINTLKTKNGHLDFNLNLQSRLPSGMYFFVFNIGDNTMSKKVIIE